MEHTDIYIPWSGWQPVRYLGRGSFGKVYEIERIFYGKKERSALKILTIPREPEEVEELYTDGYDDASVRQLYNNYLRDIRNEYDLQRQMKGHPNIVVCEDYYEEEHTDGIGWNVYIRMELLTPLQSYLKGKDLSEDEIIKLGKDMCRALLVCEKNNIVHRDIKPGNIMISDYGDFKLGDFGVARTMTHTTHATFAGAQLYMAPEVLLGKPYGKEVDIYSLGLVLYWLLNRRRMPFLPVDRIPTPNEKSIAQSKRLKGEQLPPPADGSAELKRIVLKACAYRKEDRYSSAGQMLSDLEQITSPGIGSTGYTVEEDFSDTKGTEGWDTRSKSFSGTKDYDTVGAGWGDTEGTLAKKSDKKKYDAWDDSLTVGTEGKKRKGKPGMSGRTESTPPNITNYRIPISPLTADSGGLIYYTHRGKKYQVMVPAGVTDGQNLRMTLDNGEIIYLELFVKYTDGKEITPLPSWLAGLNVPSAKMKEWVKNPLIVLIMTAVIVPSVGVIHPFLAAVGFLIGMLAFGYGISYAPSVPDSVSIRHTKDAAIAVCRMPERKYQALWAVAVNNQWVKCIESGKYVYVAVEKGSTILLAEIKEDADKNKKAIAMGQAKS